MRIEEVKQQFLVGWLGSRLLIDLQVTAGVRGPRPGCHSLALLHPRTTPPPLLIFALSLSLSRQCILSSHLRQLISHLLPSPLIQPLALSLFFSLSLLLIIILFGRPFHPLGGDSWFLYCSPPSSSAFFVLPLLGTKC